MANIPVFTSIDSTTFKIVKHSTQPVAAQVGEFLFQTTIPEEDLPLFLQKYRYSSTLEDLEINGITYYFLDITTNASSINPRTGLPQLTASSQESFTVTLTKKDIQGNTHSAVEDNDRIFVEIEGGFRESDFLDLVNGQAQGVILPGTLKGITTLEFSAVDIATKLFRFETV